MGYHKVKQYFTKSGNTLICKTEVEGKVYEELAFICSDFECNLKIINEMIESGKEKAYKYLNREKIQPFSEGVFPVTAASAVAELYRMGYKPKLAIKDVIFNDPATIVFWNDGTKTVVKAENEPFDREKGLAMAIAKKFLGNKGNYFETFKKYIKEEE